MYAQGRKMAARKILAYDFFKKVNDFLKKVVRDFFKGRAPNFCHPHLATFFVSFREAVRAILSGQYAILSATTAAARLLKLFV